MMHKAHKGEKVKTVLNAVQQPDDEGAENTEGAEGAEGTENADPAETIARLEEEARANYDRFLRVSAEFENYKKRSAREAEEFRKYANESLLKDLLPVIDNLERALLSSDATAATLAEGVGLTRREILKVIERFGATPVEALGAEFDPCRHQALMMDESGQHPPNTVVKELQKGYMLKDRLLRPALVAVSAGAPEKAECETGQVDPFKPENMGY